MDFYLSDDQRLLQSTAREVAREHFTEERARAALSDPDFRVAAWKVIADLGWAGILVPERCGGPGGTVLDACLVAEALHQAYCYVPFVGTAIAAAGVLKQLPGNEQPLGRLAEGELFSVLVDDSLQWPGAFPGIVFDWAPTATGVCVTPSGGVITTSLDVVRPGGIDLLHPLGEVEPVASGVASGDGLVRALAIIRVGLAAALTGLASEALRMAVEHAKLRQQFGQAVGDFQAVQHLCADMLADVEACRSIAYGAAWCAEYASTTEAVRVAAAAKAWCSEAAVRVCETSIQVLGGVGVTWEQPSHLLLRTAHHYRRAFGTPAALANLVADEFAADQVATVSHESS